MRRPLLVLLLLAPVAAAQLPPAPDVFHVSHGPWAEGTSGHLKFDAPEPLPGQA